MTHVTVIGAGPSGSAAAITALQAGSAVRIYEKSKYPRHKVCGEFLSPEVLPILEKLGVAVWLQSLKPHQFRNVVLHFPRSSKSFRLPGGSCGVSRHVLDATLYERACGLGALEVREVATPPFATSGPIVVATGRAEKENGPTDKARRLFGFKAHFQGPVNDDVELFFFPGGYVGVNQVEGQVTNVCGLATAALLGKFNYKVDELLHQHIGLRRRIEPLRRAIDWLHTGPLTFRHRFRETHDPSLYPAGDALSFVEPFAGTGILAALVTGISAAQSGIAGMTVDQHVRHCQQRLERAFRVSTWLRRVIEADLADVLAPLFPGRLLMKLTRPNSAG